uniref:L1 transposable element RRM domain-containing protein n=1 Tax=Anolis carolinensis TaxID=28377 RepID=A0A803SRM2_ANOCA
LELGSRRNRRNRTTKCKNKKMDRDPTNGKPIRRSSLSEQISLRDIMRELQKMQETQSMYQKISQEQLLDFKNDMQQELGTMKKEIHNIQQEIKELRQERTELRTEMKTRIEQTDLKVENIKAKSAKLELRQDRLETKELEFQLRYRNIVEEKNEDIRQVISEITAQILDCSKQEAEDGIDRGYRTSTRYAKRFNTPRDIIVRFVKKSTRDEILRKKGLTIFYKEQRWKIETEEKANDFLRILERSNKKEKEPDTENKEKKKRLRSNSPEKTSLELDRELEQLFSSKETEHKKTLEEEICVEHQKL